MPTSRRAPGPSRLLTALLWLLAGLFVLGGMALDARGAFAGSLLLFLVASVALVAPLALARRAASRAERTESPTSDGSPPT
jgi:membrane protein implicated in regulation of membrane protease activity